MASIVGECEAAASSSLACVKRAKAVLSDTHTKTHLCMHMQFELLTIVDGWDGVSDKLLPKPQFWKESIIVCILLSSGETSELHPCS